MTDLNEKLEDALNTYFCDEESAQTDDGFIYGAEAFLDMLMHRGLTVCELPKTKNQAS